MDDAELARKCIAGDVSAWAELVRRHLEVVHRAVSRVLGAVPADVEDVLQTLFLKLMEADARRLRSFQGRSKLSTWLVAVEGRTGGKVSGYPGHRPEPRMGVSGPGGARVAPFVPGAQVAGRPLRTRHPRGHQLGPSRRACSGSGVGDLS